jgi:N-methylhydantoinase A/oxoprolinase/acetone carboxylase beta subunit
MRFAGQYHEIRVELPGVIPDEHRVAAIVEAFQERYTEVYGRMPQGLPIEVLNWSLETASDHIVFALAPEAVQQNDAELARKTLREIYFASPQPGYRMCPVYDRYALLPGAALAGPCAIEEREATAIVPPGCTVRVDAFRNLVITLETEGPSS